MSCLALGGCATFRQMPPYTSVNEPGRPTLPLIRGGGAAAVLAGLSYAAAGYLDQPDMSGYASALVALLSVTTPALFLGGLLGLGLLVLGRNRSVVIAPTGFLLGSLGAIWGVIEALGLNSALGLSSLGGWWWALLFAGLTLMGTTTLLKKRLQRLGALVLTSGILGWVSFAYRPGLLRRTGADATGTRRVCGFVLLQCRSVGVRTCP